MNLTLRVSGPGFVAGVGYLGDDRTCAMRVAPILHFMRGWSVVGVVRYASERGWQVEMLESRDADGG